MIVIGVTGSIGMGKSTTARLFAAHGAVLHDADAVVHALYRGEAVPLVAARFPEAITEEGVDRVKLAAILAEDPAALPVLEAIVHPMVQAVEAERMAAARSEGRAMFVTDVPLLFETGAENRVDVVVVASAPSEIQATRVLKRPGMTPERFAAILARQVPDAEKRRRAHFIVDTGHSKEASALIVADIVRALAAKAAA
ncbi:dephospho-CoA kinase [Kaistia terrae]|uniref:Dephospho-CoA kinase n=1 Tax=Kaistia terrae TaxID=537017 RepID=A0ABW0PYE9_9HYPH|nr:dephospho-CoA kinase [Kaistia terrae]MCX5581392.1 dephospho-CoA kinase [Kaistia terrae]